MLNKAHELKINRRDKAWKVLKILGCEREAEKTRKKEIMPPHRSWVNHILDEIDSSIEYPILLDEKRYKASTPAHVASFYTEHGEIIQNCPPELMFTADETMLDTTFLQKVIIPSNMGRYVGTQPPEIPHTSAMCCCNVCGKAFPLFLIIMNRIHFPEELECIKHSMEFQLASNPSGWMDRWTFLLWVVAFISWFITYKDSLGPSFADKYGILILDGHLSRECHIALKLLAAFNVKMLVLPGHVTHILQMFDVSLAAPFKRKYTDLFRSYVKNKEHVVPGNVAATLRRQTTFAILCAWREVTTIDSILRAANAVGLFPFNPAKPLESQYVHDEEPSTTQEQNSNQGGNRRNVFSINNKEITRMENIAAIKMKINDNDRYLCRSMNEFPDMRSLVEFYINAARTRNIHMLTTPPMFRHTHYYGLCRCLD